MSVLVAILGFNLLILVHELGHFLAARAVGMRVEVFSVGMGPALIEVRGKDDTIYRLAALPIGGFVRIAGQSSLNKDEMQGPGSYLTRSLWQRGLVVAMGPLMNFGFAVLVYLGLFASFNALSYQWVRQATPVVRKVSGAAEAAGMKAFDTIEVINGEKIRSFKDIHRAVGGSEGKALRIEVARGPGGERPPFVRRSLYAQVPGLLIAEPKPPSEWPRLTIEVTPKETSAGYLLGISPEFARFGTRDLMTAASFAFGECASVTVGMFNMLKAGLAGEKELEVSSVVKITQVGADRVKMGSEWFLNLLALLSINLGFLNLLPLPALDGGRLVFIAIEMVSRRPVPPKIEMVVHGVGMVLLMGLVFVVMGKEILALF